MIELGKKYQTESGLPVRILCIDGPGSLPVIGLVNEETISYWERDGTWMREHQNTWKLVPVPTKHEGWMVYLDMPYSFSSKEGAENWMRHDNRTNEKTVIAHVTWED